ncbi:MAG: hypothetical protein HW398_1287 [Acidobacteria bacterium]|nr:hypothetical protein [Acidobacteriota bacterium]
MPPTPEDEIRMAGKGRRPGPPVPPAPSSSPKGMILSFAMIILGLPVFARWRPFSVLEWATHTVDRDLAVNLGRPELASCNQFREIASSDSTARVPTSEQILRGCPDLGPWQAWLLSPNAWFGVHRYLAPVLRVTPVSSLLFLCGAVVAYVLRLVGMKWRARGGPPASLPLSTATISRKLSSGSIESEK